MLHTFLPGDETWVAADAPVGSHSAVFEDDGTTAYFALAPFRVAGA